MGGGHAYCNLCKLPVIWVHTVSGGKIPIERATDGNISVRCEVALVDPPNIERESMRYVSHFSVCPDAKWHKKSAVSERKQNAIDEVEKHRQKLAEETRLLAAQPDQGDLFGYYGSAHDE